MEIILNKFYTDLLPSKSYDMKNRSDVEPLTNILSSSQFAVDPSQIYTYHKVGEGAKSVKLFNDAGFDVEVLDVYGEGEMLGRRLYV